MSAYYKHPVYKFVKDNDILITPPGRVCWLSLVTPKPGMKQDDGTVGKPKYGLTQMLPKGLPAVDAFIAEASKKVQEMLVLYNQGSPTELKINQILRDGDTFDLEKYPFYKGMWILNATHTDQPKVLNNEIPPVDMDPALIKGGMTGRLVVQLVVTGKGASYQIGCLQYLSDDGTRYGGGVKDYKGLLSKLEEGEPPADGGNMEPEATTAPISPEETKAALAAAAQPATGAQRNKGVKAALARL